MRRVFTVSDDRAFIWVAAVVMLVLGLASLAAPVFAQDSAVNEEADQVGVVDGSVCSQVYSAAVRQYNAGDQNANAVAGAVAEADAVNIANATGLDVSTVNACLNGFAKAPSGKTTKGPGTTGDPDTTGSTVAADVIIKTIPDQKVLADTGGPAVLLPALGLLLVTAGATVLRILLRR